MEDNTKIYQTILCMFCTCITMIECLSDVVKDYNCPQVQTFINSLSPKEAYQEKTIYQPGSLRKVLKAVTCFNFVLS